MSWFSFQRDKIQGFLDKLTNDAHVPIALFVFIVTSAYHFHTGKDLGSGYVSSLYAFYGFLGGHALVYQKWPDPTDKDHDGIPDVQEDHGPLPDPPTTTVDVNVQSNNSNTVTATAAPAAPTAPAAGTTDAKG